MKLTKTRVQQFYRAFGPFLKPYRWQIMGAYVALLATVGMTLLRPWPLKLVLDSVILDKRPLSEILPWAPAWISAADKHLLLTLLCVALVAIVLLESFFSYWQKVSVLRSRAIGDDRYSGARFHACSNTAKSRRRTANRRRHSTIDLRR